MKQASLPLPLDLHVLGLSLAFILSQDQTLRCKYIFFIFFVPLNGSGTFVCHMTYALVSFLVLVVCCFQSVKDLASFRLPTSFRKGTAKIRRFFQSAKFFSKIFQTFSSPASASALPFGKRVQRYGKFYIPPNIFEVFFQKNGDRNSVTIVRCKETIGYLRILSSLIMAR